MKVLFFAQLREVLGMSELSMQQTPATVEELRAILSSKGDTWKTFLASERTLVAVNQTMATDNTTLNKGDEVAFFPPGTGG